MPFWSSQRSFCGILTEFDWTCFFRLEGGRSILRYKKISILFKSTISTPRSCIVSRVDVSRRNSQVLSSRSRRCIDPWHPLTPRSPTLPTLSCLLLSLSCPPILPPFAAVFSSRPSSSFLVPRYAHTLAVTSRGQHVGEFKHLPLLRFWIVFDL